MPQASASDIAAMEAAQAEVNRLLRAAEERAKVIERQWLPLTTLEEASLRGIRNLRLQFNQWIDGREGAKRWALDGYVGADNGGEGLTRAYSPQAWLDFGRELGEQAAEEAKQVLTSSLFHLYTPAGALTRPLAQSAAELGVTLETKARAVGAKLEEVLAAVDPTKPWSWKTKLALGAVATVGTLALAAYVLNSLGAVVKVARVATGEDGK